MTNKINPESAMLEQSDGMWQRYMGLILLKLAPDGVTISKEDIEAFAARGEDNVVLAHGHFDSFSFKVVTREEAIRLAEWDKNQAGHC